MISLHSACCIMYSTVQRVEALQHARDPLKVMAGVLCRYHKMSEDRKTGLQANWRVAGLASVRTSHSVSVDLGFLRVVCLCIPHCITFCSATKQNGGKRILTEMSLSDGGRGLTQMCKNCLRMEERVKLWTLCLSAKSSDRLSGGTHEAVTRTHSSLKGKSFHRVSYWPLMCHWHLSRLHNALTSITLNPVERPPPLALKCHLSVSLACPPPPSRFCVLLGKAPWLWIGGRNVTFFQVWVWAGVEVLVYVGKAAGCAAPSRGTLPQSDKDSSFSIAVKLFVTRLHQRMQQLFLRTQHQ